MHTYALIRMDGNGYNRRNNQSSNHNLERQIEAVHHNTSKCANNLKFNTMQRRNGKRDDDQVREEICQLLSLEILTHHRRRYVKTIVYFCAISELWKTKSFQKSVRFGNLQMHRHVLCAMSLKNSSRENRLKEESVSHVVRVFII